MMRLAATAAIALAISTCASATTGDAWVTAWGAAPLRNPIAANIELPHPPTHPVLHGQTVREIVTVGAGGSQLRLHLDNRYGGAVNLAAVTVVHVDAAAVATATPVDVTAGGKTSLTLPPRGVLDTDAIALKVNAGDRLAISFFVPDEAVPASWHVDSRYAQTIAGGNRTHDARMPGSVTSAGYDWLARVDVLADGAVPAIVALGDSITNGFRATAGSSYPEQLALRLRSAGCVMSVINMGIDGNQVADAHGNFGQGDSMVHRFAFDVAPVSAARYLIVLGGINDIGEPTMAAHAQGSVQPGAKALADPVIASLSQIVAMAHQRGLRIYGATLPPFGGTQGAFTVEGERARQAINAWIRHDAPYDAVIDFDATLRDPKQPERMQVRLDSGDHIHPNDAGYRAMAQSVPLSLFQCGGKPAP